jgi:hypothetical protein
MTIVESTAPAESTDVKDELEGWRHMRRSFAPRGLFVTPIPHLPTL